ncbi:LysR substrate-binding domain-containing protein [Bosea rubneri]|uniref:LysR substrate-binding domain-containing protein n=1 Tax=Bosea rubneri TaxID=3075434 RepID=A0ABU3S7V9_9HYPH|nr:LysR substrate-binding domain-containing protein [Bosea sp. ZW T0_25]MDU0340878.1 LysR substrate-binding domain-containing protein [Bosea sp. ZW T0_25]
MASPNLPPSTTALRVFLAVARLGSTAKAASAVHLTQSAVSKQIQALEEHLGIALFERSPTGLKATEAGTIYRPYAEAAIEQMERGARRIAERTALGRPIRLHLVAIAGERWLMERFPSFAQAHPEIDVQFTNFISESQTEDSDIDIVHGIGPWPDREAHYLFGRQVALVAAPALLERMGGFTSPADIQKMTLLQHFQMPAFWAEFTEAHGLRGAVPAHTVRYGYYSVIIRAAMAGLGVALAPRCYVAEELASGTLVNPLSLGFDSTVGCWMTLNPRGQRGPGVEALVGWLREEAARFEAEASA